MREEDKALAVERLGHGYGERTILQDVSFELGHGERIAIVGVSGAGKSTLLNLIAAFEEPRRGYVRYGAHGSRSGIRFGKGEMKLATGVRRRIGFVFQSAPMMEAKSAIENIALPLLIDGVDRKRSLARARELAAQLGLGDRIVDGPVRQLSGGERQRVAMARAVVRDPVLVVADEPTGNLDPARAHGVEALLGKVTGRQGRALLLVTHDLALAHRIATRVLVLRGGKLHAPPAEPRERHRVALQMHALSMDLAHGVGMAGERTQ